MPLATLLLIGGVLAGILLALLVKPLVALGARRARRRADARLHAAIGEIGRDHIVEPVRSVLHDYAQARDALTEAGK